MTKIRKSFEIAIQKSNYFSLLFEKFWIVSPNVDNVFPSGVLWYLWKVTRRFVCRVGLFFEKLSYCFYKNRNFVAWSISRVGTKMVV